MGQRLKEYYYPEDYGVPCNVDQITKFKVSDVLLKIDSVKTLCDDERMVKELDIIRSLVEKLYFRENNN